MQHLTPKQARFVDEYLVDLNGTAAAERAGYGIPGARVAAHRLLTNANVRAVLKARQAQDAKRLGIEREGAIQGLLEAIEMAKVKGDPAGMISGWKAISQMLGFSVPQAVRQTVSVAGSDIAARLEAMTDSELQDIITGTPAC